MTARAAVIASLAMVTMAAAGCADAATTTTTATASTTTTTAAASAAPPATAEQRFPDVIGAEAVLADDGTWTVSATLSSPYDTPERYADAWRVVGPDGTEYAVRVLTHDHANEQPFTRSRSGIAIPESVDVVTVEGRDLHNGWGGDTFELRLPGR